MHVPTTRSFTPSRVIALALIAVLASGLAYLRFAPDTGSVSVPEGAKAGDVVLERGEYGGYEADRGTLVVPEIALITTIVGAAVGGNPLLLALDMTWERSVGSRFAAAPSQPASWSGERPGVTVVTSPSPPAGPWTK